MSGETRFDVIFKGLGKASGRMRNDISVEFSTMKESFELATDEGAFHGDSNSHHPFRTPYSMGFRDPGFVDFSFPVDGNRPESSGHHGLGPLPHP